MAKIVFESESELEQLIFEKQQDGYCEVINEMVHDCFRQQHIGSYGIIDILAVQRGYEDRDVPSVDFIIYEIKKEVIKNEAVAQLSRYIQGLNHILSDSAPPYEPHVRGVLVAPDIDLTGDTCFLCDQAESIELYTVNWDISKGLKFENRSGWFKEQEALCGKTEAMLAAVQDGVNQMLGSGAAKGSDE